MVDLRRAARPVRVTLGAAVALALTACDDPAPAPSIADPPPPLASLAPPRRPTRRYYLLRTSERCQIFSEDDYERTEPFATPCPEYLRIGERIRIVGKTCFVENSAEPEREKPVVCPDPLTHFEKDLRAAGKMNPSDPPPPP